MKIRTVVRHTQTLNASANCSSITGLPLVPPCVCFPHTIPRSPTRPILEGWQAETKTLFCLSEDFPLYWAILRGIMADGVLIAAWSGPSRLSTITGDMIECANTSNKSVSHRGIKCHIFFKASLFPPRLNKLEATVYPKFCMIGNYQFSFKCLG